MHFLSDLYFSLHWRKREREIICFIGEGGLVSFITGLYETTFSARRNHWRHLLQNKAPPQSVYSRDLSLSYGFLGTRAVSFFSDIVRALLEMSEMNLLIKLFDKRAYFFWIYILDLKNLTLLQSLHENCIVKNLCHYIKIYKRNPRVKAKWLVAN